MTTPRHLPVLPDMRCDAGCEMCCTEVVPCTESELVRVLVYANEHDIKPQVSRSDMCVWFQDGRCAVHEARPLMCHLFGHVDHPSLTCHKDPTYNGNITTEEQAAAIMQAKANAGPAVRYLHEAIDAALPDPETSVWRSRVQPHVWDGINQFRKAAGLPALRRKYVAQSDDTTTSTP